ncbi:MAG TPA: tetratricopeptide repeat protein, partial [Myxococcota bacterium]|nr:tetratricopeptide repeat protein [Myxococcota bacterium]
EVLDRGAREIDTGLRDEPGVRATLIATLGSVYASLGLYKQADELLGRAEVGAPLDPEADALVAIARGEVQTSLGAYPAANREFERALAALRAEGPEREAERARALIAWGESLATTDEFAAAREKIAEGIAAARRARPEAKALIARGLEARGLTALLAGELDEAEPVYREALAMRIAESGENHPKVSEDLNSLGSLEYLRGNRAQAAEYFARVLEIERRVFSPTHPTLATTLNNLARVQLEQRKFLEAREQLRLARDLWLAERSATHDDMAFVFNNLALAEVGLGNDEAAKKLFASAWAAADKHRHRMRGPILTDLADLECRAKRHAEAAPRLKRARALLADDYPDDPWRLAWLELVHASCLLAAGDAAGADALLTANLQPVLDRWPDDTMMGLSALERAVAIRNAVGPSETAAGFAQRVARARGTARP